jgi:DNA-binding NtrC family response regulator
MNTYDALHQRPYFGLSPAIETVKWNVNAAAAAHCAVLLRGETGTGKGMAARWIHDHSQRRDKPFVDINCAGLKGGLLKSELFGHARGSFTGALNDRPGLIEQADGGTLFLDEIGDMDIEVQCLLLKAVEEKCYRRVGENKPRSSDFRLICATNRNLRQAMDDGTFRPDLFHRINTLIVKIPPLRERKEDIAGLLTRILESMGYKHPPPSDDVVKALEVYGWPGNVRELRNAAERAMVFARGEKLRPEHFMGLYEKMADNSEAAATNQQEEAVWDIYELEKRHILRALDHFHGDKTKTSGALGISTSSLYRKLDKLLCTGGLRPLDPRSSEEGGGGCIAKK